MSANIVCDTCRKIGAETVRGGQGFSDPRLERDWITLGMTRSNGPDVASENLRGEFCSQPCLLAWVKSL